MGPNLRQSGALIVGVQLHKSLWVRTLPLSDSLGIFLAELNANRDRQRALIYRAIPRESTFK